MVDMVDFGITFLLIGFIIWGTGKDLKDADYEHYPPFIVFGKYMMLCGLGGFIGFGLGFLVDFIFP